MLRESSARIAFAASTVLFGVIAILWHDVETWQSLYGILRLPFGAIVGDVLMVALLASAVVLAAPAGARMGSISLGALYAIFTLACIPAIVSAPRAFDAYDGFFEQVAILCGATAVLAPSAARIGLGLSAVSFAAAQIVYFGVTAAMVPAWIPFGQTFWAVLTTAAFGLAAIALIFNLRARLAAALTASMVAAFGVLVWIPQLASHPGAHGNRSEFALTCLIASAYFRLSDRP